MGLLKNRGSISLTLIGMLLFDPVLFRTLWGASVVGSKHDLSTNWDQYSTQVCAFCHTPHFANPTLPIQAPLWNRSVDFDKVFQPARTKTGAGESSPAPFFSL